MPKHEMARQRLDNWARWITQRLEGSLGYPKTSPFARYMTVPSGRDDVSMIPVNDVEARATHDTVDALRLTSSALYVAIMCRYVGNPFEQARRRRPLSLSETAKVMQVAPSTVSGYMAQALAHVDAKLRGSFTE